MYSIVRVVRLSCSSTPLSCIRTVHSVFSRSFNVGPVERSHNIGVPLQRNFLIPNIFHKMSYSGVHPEKLKHFVKARLDKWLDKWISGYVLSQTSLGQYVARNLTTLVQKPKLSTYSHFLKTRHENLSLLPDCKIPLNEQEETDSISTSRRQVALTVTPPVIPSQPPNAKADKETPAKVAEEHSSWRRKTLRPSQNIKRVEELTRGCELNLPSESNAEFELDNNATDPDLNKVGRRNMSTFMLQESTKENMVDQVMTLFDRVKIDSRSKMGVEDQDGNHSVVESMGSRQIMREPSLTYKLVNSKKMRREMALKAQYKIMPNMEKKNMRTDTSICNKNNQLIVLSPLKSELECVKHLENDSRQSPLFLDSQKMSC